MRYKFYLKKVGDLTSQEKEQLMRLMIETYPPFKKYYLKNKYYSTVRPQMENVIKDGESVIGAGKLLHRKIKAGATHISFFAFGLLIAKEHREKGLGTKLIAKNIMEAKKRGADVLYGSTANPSAERIVKKLGFKKLHVPIYYKDAETKKIREEKNGVWVFEFKKGLVDKIDGLKRFYIGTGPL